MKRPESCAAEPLQSDDAPPPVGESCPVPDVPVRMPPAFAYTHRTATPTEDLREKASFCELMGDVQNDAVQALVALGYGSTEALKAVRQVEWNSEMEAEDLLKQALKYMTF